MTQIHIPAIAIIGMAGRFPDAPDVETFWRNLEQGHESLTTFSDEELLRSGVPEEIFRRPDFVRRSSVLEDSDQFDAGFFGFNPREAELMDPQHRVLLECAWSAMENAGYGDGKLKNVGVYAGTGQNTYVFNLLSQPELMQNAGFYQVMIGSDKDFLASRIAYKLDLRGPCVTVQTACSTSLVAVHMAVQALRAHECDIALAGGVALRFPQKTGYLYQEGMIFSPDGHCRPFDAAAGGIHGGEGAAMVVLRRLDDALRDRDKIRGVILGSAINNDGADKIGYTAPSIEGQVKALSAALNESEVAPETVGYIEAHGTATQLGDTIEFAALSKVYGEPRQPCAIGAVKSNIGHLDVAAGVAGLIKTLLILQHGKIPPTLHFRKPNPQLPWMGSRFYINTATKEWRPAQGPRRAAVSSFGIGGTNAHIVLEEAPPQQPSQPLWPRQLLALSAASAAALHQMSCNLTDYLAANPGISLADVCYTLQTGRKRFAYRRTFVCANVAEALRTLRQSDLRECSERTESSANRPVAFMFSGQGAQHHGMARDLYQFQPTFRRELDACADILSESGIDLRGLLYGAHPPPELNDTRIAQPALFSVEYALARMWMYFGVKPAAMIGHSIGEFVAACLAGVFSLEDALGVVARRGELMQSMPRGSMLFVGLSEEELIPVLGDSVSVAAVNGRSNCTLSGPDEAIAKLQNALEAEGVTCSRLHTSHAFHSRMMEPAADAFRSFLNDIPLHPPTLPFVSNVSGDWITPQEATSPDYWTQHLLAKVRFAAGIRELVANEESLLLEIGPGHALTGLARESGAGGRAVEAFPSLPHPKDPKPASSTILTTIGSLWLRGVALDWERIHEGESLYRTPLPTYPFQRRRYFIEFSPPAGVSPSPTTDVARRLEIDEWFRVPSWKRSLPVFTRKPAMPAGPWLIFADAESIAGTFAAAFSSRESPYYGVHPGSSFSFDGNRTYSIDPQSANQYRDLLRDLIAKRTAPRTILFCWSLHAARESFENLIRLAQAFGEQGYEASVDLIVVSSGMYQVLGNEGLAPDMGLLLGPCKTIPIEYPNIQCRWVDLASAADFAAALPLLLDEAHLPPPLHGIAYRGGLRWEQFFEKVPLPPAEDRIRRGGTYLITGGLGGIGLTLARYLASFGTRIVFTTRTPFVAREEWQSWLETHADDDPTRVRIGQLRELEQSGAQVLVLTADAADREQMRNAICQVHDQFGAIHGIIHAAGVAGGGLIQLKKNADTESVLAPKVSGTKILQSLTAEDPLDFFVLCSSINSLAGMVGGVDYTAANAWLDARASAAAALEGRAVMISIDWDTWQEVGMAVNTHVPRELHAARKAVLETAIRPAEGVEVFRRVLGARLPQVAVVTREVQKNRNQVASTPEISEVLMSAVPPATHDRPELLNAFQPAETETQRRIAAIWREALGQDQIGIDDNFFELGGHSLIATSILGRLRTTFAINLPLRVIFESPTIRSLAEHVDTLLWAVSHQTNHQDMEEREELEI